jgi:hypothetical protein
LFEKLGINDTQHNNALHYAGCQYAELRILLIGMQIVIMLNVITLIVVAPNGTLNSLSRIAGAPIVWKFVREEWPYLVSRFSLNDRYLGRLPRTVTSDFSSKFQLQGPML